VKLTVYNFDGRQLYTIDGVFLQGLNEVRVTREQLNGATGILFYRIQSGGWSATKKMMRTD
jgi:hypothetical protein